MAQSQIPQKPPNLNPEHIYLHITTPSDPFTLASSLQPGASKDGSIVYVGPVGELKDEHIFEIKFDGGPVKRDSVEGKRVEGEVMAALKGKEGVKGVKVLEMKQRSKRGGDL